VDNVYTDEVKKLMYEAKGRLPADFPLVTEVISEGPAVFINIEVQRKHFDWRTVEDRVAIATTINRLRDLIRETGMPCEITPT
jgi:hypothetical protein